MLPVIALISILIFVFKIFKLLINSDSIPRKPSSESIKTSIYYIEKEIRKLDEKLTISNDDAILHDIDCLEDVSNFISKL